MSTNLLYNPKLKELSRQLRQQGILSEVILWNFIKGKQLRGLIFTRQKPIDNYIVDFYAPALKLVIEIDGGSHGHKLVYDELRQKTLESLGLTILHFNDSDIKKDINSVLRHLDDWVTKHTPASGHPSQEGN